VQLRRTDKMLAAKTLSAPTRHTGKGHVTVNNGSDSCIFTQNCPLTKHHVFQAGVGVESV
jgi:hypothetical protein